MRCEMQFYQYNRYASYKLLYLGLPNRGIPKHATI